MARVMARVLIPDADGSRSRWRDGAQFAYTATLFVFGAGDGNRTRTVSLGRVLILPCFPVLQRYWRPQLASGDPYRPGLVAGVWPGSLGSRVENRALAQSSPGRGSPRPNPVSHYRGCQAATLSV